MNQDQGLHLTSEVLKTLAKAKKVLELTMDIADELHADGNDLYQDECFHDIHCESIHAYREICKLQDLMLGIGSIDHKYKVGEPVDITHLVVIK